MLSYRAGANLSGPGIRMCTRQPATNQYQSAGLEQNACCGKIFLLSPYLARGLISKKSTSPFWKKIFDGRRLKGVHDRDALQKKCPVISRKK